jgi:acetyl/propionyl-CoA carboxylase alpha subunit
VWHWLSLDPTPPGGEATDATTVGAWLDDARATWATFFMDFIVGYNPARRQRAVDTATDWLERWWWAVLAAPFAGVVSLAVGEGEQVEPGQAVASIEAMKMEASITTPVGGTVQRVAIGPVQQVEGGDLVLVVN